MDVIYLRMFNAKTDEHTLRQESQRLQFQIDLETAMIVEEFESFSYSRAIHRNQALAALKAKHAYILRMLHNQFMRN